MWEGGVAGSESIDTLFVGGVMMMKAPSSCLGPTSALKLGSFSTSEGSLWVI